MALSGWGISALAGPWVRKILHMYSLGVTFCVYFSGVCQAAADFLVHMHTYYEHISNGGQNNYKIINSSRIPTKMTV